MVRRHADSNGRRDERPAELARYLDYCSELLSLTSKLAALHADEAVGARAERKVVAIGEAGGHAGGSGKVGTRDGETISVPAGASSD